MTARERGNLRIAEGREQAVSEPETATLPAPDGGSAFIAVAEEAQPTLRWGTPVSEERPAGLLARITCSLPQINLFGLRHAPEPDSTPDEQQLSLVEQRPELGPLFLPEPLGEKTAATETDFASRPWNGETARFAHLKGVAEALPDPGVDLDRIREDLETGPMLEGPRLGGNQPFGWWEAWRRRETRNGDGSSLWIYDPEEVEGNEENGRRLVRLFPETERPTDYGPEQARWGFAGQLEHFLRRYGLSGDPEWLKLASRTKYVETRRGSAVVMPDCGRMMDEAIGDWVKLGCPSKNRPVSPQQMEEIATVALGAYFLQADFCPANLSAPEGDGERLWSLIDFDRQQLSKKPSQDIIPKMPPLVPDYNRDRGLWLTLSGLARTMKVLLFKYEELPLSLREVVSPGDWEEHLADRRESLRNRI